MAVGNQQHGRCLLPCQSGQQVNDAREVILDTNGQDHNERAGCKHIFDLLDDDGDGTLDLRIDDRMYLVSPDVLINESRMFKFGFDVGEILLVIRREPGAGAQET